MRTAHLGTSEFAAAVLRRLAESPHRPALVVTPPDRRRGRGRRMASPPAAEAARELGIELHQTQDVNSPESVEAIRAAAPEVIAVCAFGQLIKEPLLSDHLMLNVHPSLVPRWRGAAPIERALIAGDPVTGVTIMRVTEGLDSGPVALAEEIPISEADDYGSLSSKLAELGAELLVRALDRLQSGELTFAEQDESKATYAEKISPEERRLDPSRPAAELERTIRALTPHIGAHLEVDDGERLGVRAASTVSDALPAGALEARGCALLLGCADGALRLETVQPPGGRPMSAEDFLRGHEPPSRAR
ncbi:MAG TPA: methionyl-tRNA formyltransferase [Solirubrobacterales bacterium]|nr:methionyl-tRNA formyltransferase [Solirubrobacterales bacterium]